MSNPTPILWLRIRSADPDVTWVYIPKGYPGWLVKRDRVEKPGGGFYSSHSTIHRWKVMRDGECVCVDRLLDFCKSWVENEINHHRA